MSLNKSLLKPICIGLVAGALSGLFGVGGGILIVPALIIFMNMAQKQSHGTSLAAILPIAVSGVIGYTTGDSINWAAALFLTIGSAGFGAIIGTKLLQVLSRRFVAVLFIAVLIATAARLSLFSEVIANPKSISVLIAIEFVMLGLVSGILAGLLGVGGGIVMVPAMVILFSMPTTIAKGTSLVAIIPTAIIGTKRNITKDNVDLRLAAIIGFSGVASSFLTSRISLNLDDRLSNNMFAALLAIVAVKLIRDEQKAV
jgi:uncharacterized membrane protein YfcA